MTAASMPAMNTTSDPSFGDDTVSQDSSTADCPVEDTGLDLIGIGSALVDLVVAVDDAFLATRVGGAKGGMEMVSAEAIVGLLAAIGQEPERAAGGAASNTTVGVAGLGLRAAFIGCCGRDPWGDFYAQALVERGCRPCLRYIDDAPTGLVLSMVTEDAERTMRTCLAAAARLDPMAITAEWFAGARLVMLEGYTLFDHDLTQAIVTAARQAGCQVALDLASFEVVTANRVILESLLDGAVDLVFANETEARAWCADGEMAALDDLAARCSVAVVKLGAEGAVIASGDRRIIVAGEPAVAVDTTGAGDNWAAGFLGAYLRDLPLEICGRLGALAGAEAVSVTGAQLPVAAWRRLRGFLEAQL